MVQRNNRNLLKIVTPPIYLCLGIVFVFFLQNRGIIQAHWLGIYPRNVAYLHGIITTPFVHGDLQHLIGNLSVLFPLLVLLFYTHKKFSFNVLITLWIITGFLIWVFARPSYHIGASGIVYAIQTYILVSGIIKKRPWLMAVGAVSIMLFGGGFVFGLLPFQEHVSWESHGIGALTGIGVAWLFRNQGPSKAKRFTSIPVDEYQQFDIHKKT
jgi:membrane associated rhomboid family serine protease